MLEEIDLPCHAISQINKEIHEMLTIDDLPENFITALKALKAITVSILDRHIVNWRAYINPDTLDMRKGTACILGQLYGSYGDGLDALPELDEFSALEDLPIDYLLEYFEDPLDRNKLILPKYGSFSPDDIYDILDELWQEELEGVKYEGQNPELLDYGC